jgi:hypothetical protein
MPLPIILPSSHSLLYELSDLKSTIEIYYNVQLCDNIYACSESVSQLIPKYTIQNIFAS